MGDPDRRPVLLFDGVCNLCDASVRFVLERDARGALLFAALGTDAARRVLATAGVDDPSALPDSLVLVDEGRVHVESDAALGVARHLRAPWRWLAVLRLVPRPLRDRAYRFVARRRHRWFGRREACRLPRPGEAERFLG